MPETHKETEPSFAEPSAADRPEPEAAALSDDALEAMLAQWAEAEFEPPADFHQQTMARLRAAASDPNLSAAPQNAPAAPARRRNAVGRPARRWAAAAAVMVLCALPAVHLLRDAGAPADETQIMLARSGPASQSQNAAVTQDTPDASPQDATDIQRSAGKIAPAPGPEGNGGGAEEAAADGANGASATDKMHETDTAAGAETPDAGQAPMMASLEPPEEALALPGDTPQSGASGAGEAIAPTGGSAGGGDPQSALSDGDLAALAADAQALQKRVDALKTDIASLKEEIAQLQALLTETPGDADLEAKVTALTEKLTELERALSQLQTKDDTTGTDAG